MQSSNPYRMPGSPASNLLSLTLPGRQQVIVQVLGPLAATGEVQVPFLVGCFGLAQPWLLNEPVNESALCLSLSFRKIGKINMSTVLIPHVDINGFYFSLQCCVFSKFSTEP